MAPEFLFRWGLAVPIQWKEGKRLVLKLSVYHKPFTLTYVTHIL